MGCSVSYDDTSRYALRHIVRNNLIRITPTPVQHTFCTNYVRHGLLKDCDENELLCETYMPLSRMALPVQKSRRASTGNSGLLSPGAARGSQWRKSFWSNIQVGDIIRVRAGDYVPADCILLHCYPKLEYMEDGAVIRKAYFDTTIIDGKPHSMRLAVHQDFSIGQYSEAGLRLETDNDWSKRNDYFMGTLIVNDIEEVLNHEHFLSRYSKLLETCSVSSVAALVIFTGEDTFAAQEYVNTTTLNARRLSRLKIAIEAKSGGSGDGVELTSLAESVHRPTVMIVEPEGIFISNAKTVRKVWTTFGCFASESPSEWINEGFRSTLEFAIKNRSISIREKVSHILYAFALCFDSTLQLSPTTDDAFGILSTNEMDKAMMTVAQSLGCNLLHVGPPQRKVYSVLLAREITVSILEIMDFNPVTNRQVFVGEADNGEVWVLCKGLPDAVIPLLKPKYESAARQAIEEVAPGQIILCAYRRFINREEYDRMRFLSSPDNSMRLCCALALSHPLTNHGLQLLSYRESLAQQKLCLLSRRPIHDLHRWVVQLGLANSKTQNFHYMGLTHANDVVVDGAIESRVRLLEVQKEAPQIHTEVRPVPHKSTIPFECCNKKDLMAYVEGRDFKGQVVFINNINIHMNGEKDEMEWFAPILEADLVVVGWCPPLQKAAYVRLLNLHFHTIAVGYGLGDVPMIQEATRRGVIMTNKSQGLLGVYDVECVTSLNSV
eukprot:PhF_6_TR39688/c0_g1_i2/m.58993